MELGKFKDAEELLTELTEQKPEDITLKLATASLYKKMSKSKADIYQIYDQIIEIAVRKSDAEAIKKHTKSWLETLDETVFAEYTDDIVQRAAELTPFLKDPAIATLLLTTLNHMGELGHVSNRQRYAIIKPLLDAKILSLKDMKEFQQKLIVESEAGMG